MYQREREKGRIDIDGKERREKMQRQDKSDTKGTIDRNRKRERERQGGRKRRSEEKLKLVTRWRPGDITLQKD